MPKAEGKSLPIALSVQKATKKKKMAFGGKAEDTNEPAVPARKPDDKRLPKDEFMSGENEVKDNEFEEMLKMPARASADAEQDGMSVAERIRRKKMMAEGGMVDSDQDGMDAMKKEMYADGGMVDLDMNDEESPNQYDKMNRKAANAHQYDDSQISPQPEDSNQHGSTDIENELDRSIVAAIRRKMKSGM